MKNRLILIMILSSISISFNPINSVGNNLEIKNGNGINAEIQEASLISGISQELFSLKKYNNTYGGRETLCWNEGWINASCVNIRSEPSKDSKILGVLNYNDKVEFYQFGNRWSCIKFEGSTAYVYSKFISRKEMNYTDYLMPITNGFKSFMSYRAITNSNSHQYKLQKNASTEKYGIRQVDGRYCVAIGTAFTSRIGQYFDLVLENGEVIPCILGDVKADIHTDSENCYTISNGCASEFIVDMDSLSKKARLNGDMSFCCKRWNSRISLVRVYKKNFFDNN